MIDGIPLFAPHIPSSVALFVVFCSVFPDGDGVAGGPAVRERGFACEMGRMAPARPWDRLQEAGVTELLLLPQFAPCMSPCLLAVQSTC